MLFQQKMLNDLNVVRPIISHPYLLERQEIVENQPSVQDLQERWPALFQQEEINAEYFRITTLPLQSRFMASLDRQSSQLLQVIRSKGGALREKTKDTIKVMDQSLDIDIRRECLLKCLITYLGEDTSCLIKEYQADQREEAEREFEKTTMAFFVIRETDALSRALDISIVIDGVEVLNELPSVACACAMMFGLIYALNLKYPEGLKYTFEAFQKIIMDIESKQMSQRVQNLSSKLQE
ncbi:uncharacterized protein LOC127958163 [Carassius gibelio]|uniref:uncharacterized protein LOC127957838 n=1 Tax=Carassius gibelio TaxID=101364 RepID=UPI002279AD99|nr:uncharacterized protein LOC127957836 isoform X1 [Carassius gibelio]XP_052412502.1 uncharacterized protein LOC127957838 [Carassius gibelio]XP_052412503.1 uncharacterized protein LOC127957839 [Carassius gibelio]XP_052412921.1 uncharacterized protein LOC127958162 [Carassius gibelio]XP_052412922.1 uncharacterized protein LOC127958163 [Carassius gibelio]